MFLVNFSIKKHQPVPPGEKNSGHHHESAQSVKSADQFVPSFDKFCCYILNAARNCQIINSATTKAHWSGMPSPLTDM